MRNMHRTAFNYVIVAVKLLKGQGFIPIQDIAKNIPYINRMSVINKFASVYQTQITNPIM